jgi:hypothetical protein
LAREHPLAGQLVPDSVARIVAVLLVAVAAIHCPARSWLERHRRRAPTIGADGREHWARLTAVAGRPQVGAEFSATLARGTTLSATGRAPRGWNEAPFGVKLLLTGGEDELSPTIPADQCLIGGDHHDLRSFPGFPWPGMTRTPRHPRLELRTDRALDARHLTAGHGNDELAPQRVTMRPV